MIYRTQVLGCSNDKDFLAKLYCVRQAFDELLLVQHNREYIINAGKDIMITLLVQSQQVTTKLSKNLNFKNY